MRKFVLYNEKNEYIPLNGPRYYLIDPSGIGTNPNPLSINMEQGFYKLVKRLNMDQSEFSGSLLIYDEKDTRNAYLYYRAFIDFCYAADKLYFGYAPYSNDNPSDIAHENTRYILLDDAIFEKRDSGGDVAKNTYVITKEYITEVTFDEIEKGEIGLDGALYCNVRFSILTPWFETMSHSETLPEGENNSIDQYYSIGECNSYMDAAFDFEIELHNATNVKIQIVKNYFDYSIGEQIQLEWQQASVDGIVKYSSVRGNSFFILESFDHKTKTDLLQNPTFEFTGFLRPKKENYWVGLQISCDSRRADYGTFKSNFYNYHLGV